MLKLSFLRIDPSKLPRVRDWMRELAQRSDEVAETFVREGTDHEIVYLLEDYEFPVLVYAMEAQNLEKAREQFSQSKLPIDLKHAEVMKDVVVEVLNPEILFELRYR